MSVRENLLTVLASQPVDGVPVAPFFHVNYVKAFFQRHEIDVVHDTIAVYDHFGFDIIHRNCTPAIAPLLRTGEHWDVEQEVEQIGRDTTTTTVIHTPGGDLREVNRDVWVSEYDAESTRVEFVLKSEADFDLLCEYLPADEVIDTSLIIETREALGDRGIVAPWIDGAFNYVAFYFRPLEELLQDALDSPEFYHRMMRFLLERNKQEVAQLIAAGADVISYGGNVASSKIISEAFFRAFVLPYEKELIDFIQDQQVSVLYHNCGYARTLFNAYNDLGMHAYESLTPPPYGDTALEHAIATLRPDMVLSGNIDQIDFLMRADTAAITTQVREVLDSAKKRGNFILATTDYFHEDTPQQAIQALADAGREYGRY